MMKWLAILFGILVVVIIVLADAGTLPRYLGPFYDFPNGDKVGHFLLYGILVFLINLTLFQVLPPSSSLPKSGRSAHAVPKRCPSGG